MTADAARVQTARAMGLDAILARLRVSEGWREHAYLDTRGYVTIGYGFNLGFLKLPPGVRHQDVRIIPVNPISKAVGESLLVAKVLETSTALRAELPWMGRLDDVRQQVLVDMAYNMGVRGSGKPGDKKGLVDGWPTFLGLVEQGRYQAAVDIMLRSPYARQVGDRAVRLAHMLAHGKETE